MKHHAEYRDPEAAQRVLKKIHESVDTARDYRFMEFCGGHTHAISRFGLHGLLPANVRLIHGPGCPVCVLPIGRLDMAIALAMKPESFFAAMATRFASQDLAETPCRKPEPMALTFARSIQPQKSSPSRSNRPGKRSCFLPSVLRPPPPDSTPPPRDPTQGTSSGERLLQSRPHPASHQGDPGGPRTAPATRWPCGARARQRGDWLFPVRPPRIRLSDADCDRRLRTTGYPAGHPHVGSSGQPGCSCGGKRIHPGCRP